jgi:signal transduction histidine kinase/ActR/RegA family two-component response regulator
MVKKNIFAGLAFGAVMLITAVFFLSLSGIDSKKADLLHTDLTASPAYAKNGFESAYASMTDPEFTEWDLTLPAGHGTNIVMSRLPRADSSDADSDFMSFKNRTVNEYTIMIPFRLDKDEIDMLYTDNPISPGMFLSGIGENWEIFLNGDVVVKQLHINSEDEITSFRSQRNVSIPFDRRYLKEGENFLVFHIIGTQSSNYTGLFYTKNYYIGDYQKISGVGVTFLTIALCTAYLFLGLYHMLLYFLRKTDAYNFLYGIFASLAAVYFFTRSAVIYHIVDNTAVTQRIEFSVLFLVLFAFSAFLESLSFGKIKPLTIVYGIACAVLIVVQCLIPIWSVYDILIFWQIYGTLHLLYIFGYDVIYAFIKHAKDQYETEKVNGTGVHFRTLFFRHLRDSDLGNIFIIMIIVIFICIFDIFDAVFLNTGALVSRYSSFVFLVWMAFLLARKYSNRFEATSQMKESLEEIVKQRTRQLEEQVLVAEAASRSKSSFLANMSHEIRTPLNAVIGMTSIGEQSDEMSRKNYAFSKIKEASAHLLGVINDILDMSKIEAGKLEFSVSDFNVRSIIERVENVMRFKTDEKHHVFEVTIAEDIPLMLHGDDMRLAQVITNLIGNAVKFTPESGQISLRAFLDDETDGVCLLRFLIKDTGIGITEEQKSKLFRSFQQAESSTTRSYGGTGLGLALSKQIVELMEGEIWVDSEPGIGSTFGFTVRIPRAEMGSEENTDEVAIEAMQDGEFIGRVILLAEDVEINREILIALTEATGVTVDCAENGAEAVKMYEQNPERYHLILMDLQMTVMDGYEAAKSIRAGDHPQAKEVPIVAMTANVFKDDIEQSYASGMNGHLGKPIDTEKLLAVLRLYLSRD